MKATVKEVKAKEQSEADTLHIPTRAAYRQMELSVPVVQDKGPTITTDQ